MTARSRQNTSGNRARSVDGGTQRKRQDDFAAAWLSANARLRAFGRSASRRAFHKRLSGLARLRRQRETAERFHLSLNLETIKSEVST